MESQQFKLTSFVSIVFVSIFGLYPLIPERQESLSVIVMSICCLIIFIKKGKLKNIFNFRLLVTSSIFLFFLFSTLLSEDWHSGFRKIETMMSLLIIPLNFYFLLGESNLNFNKLKEYFYKIFYISNIVFCLICTYIFCTYSNPKYPNRDANFFRIALSENTLIGDHPIYVSIFLSIAILIGFAFIKIKPNRIRINILILIGQGVLSFVLFLLMSKGIIIALLISLIVLIFGSYKGKKTMVFVLICMMTVLFFVLIPPQNNRFKQLLKKESYETIDLNNSTSIRLNVLKCALQKARQSPFFGYGLGDVQDELDRCYQQNNLEFPIGKYNSHNQYLFVMLSGGFLGIIIFIYWIIYFFKVSLKNKDYLMLSILIFYMFGFLFENILSRQSGVILFSFIINLLVVSNLNKEFTGLNEIT